MNCSLPCILSSNMPGGSNDFGHGNCESYFLLHYETKLGDGFRSVLYFLALGYCFIGLSAITSHFFRSMENVVKHTRRVEEIDPYTNAKIVKYKKVWNYTIADITLLAFGTSFPQISLATIDAIRNIGNLYAGGLGPGTLVGSAAFDLFPIHAVCVVVPKAGELKKISDLGVWLVELFWSFWAYIWLYIILEVWTPNVITLWEALITVLQFGLLLIHAYAQDKRWPYLSLPINSVNIYVGIGLPWLIDTLYKEPLRIENARGLSFSLLVFFATSVGCIGVLVLRRVTLGAELGGPRLWAWLTSGFLMLLWLIFITLSSLRVSDII